MNDLLTFLRDQCDADEREANGSTEPFLYGDRTGMDGLHPQIRMHLYRWTPARVKPHVVAIRAIIKLHADYDFPYNPDDGPGDYSWTGQCDHCFKDWPCPTLLAVASAYADRPGFRPEWLTE